MGDDLDDLCLGVSSRFHGRDIGVGYASAIIYECDRKAEGGLGLLV